MPTSHPTSSANTKHSTASRLQEMNSRREDRCAELVPLLEELQRCSIVPRFIGGDVRAPPAPALVAGCECEWTSRRRRRPMTNTSHVELRSVLEFAEDEEPQVRFDEASRHLILIKHRELVAIPVRPLPHAGGSDAAASQPTIQCDSQGKVEQASVSLCQRYVAVQRSHVELEFLDLQRSSCSAQRQPSDGSGAWFRHDCAGGGTRARWRILSFHWTGAPVADFVVVTTAGVEFYSFSAEKRALKLVKHLAQPVAWAMYSHEMRLLLLASGSQASAWRVRV
jgi:hypothetical protein